MWILCYLTYASISLQWFLLATCIRYMEVYVWNKGLKFLNDELDDSLNDGTVKAVIEEALHITDKTFTEQSKEYVHDLVQKSLKTQFEKSVNKYRKELTDCE